MPTATSRRRGPRLAAALLVSLIVGACSVTALPTPTEPSEEQAATASSNAPTIVIPNGSELMGSGATGSSSWYQVAMTGPIYPDDPADHQHGLDTRLVQLIDTAKTSLDIADYDFDLADVAQAMARAAQRGVIVRMVTDTDTIENDDEAIQAAFQTVKAAGIPIVDDDRSAIMHDKFTVVDHEWVSTGSWNYTDGDTYHLNNNMIVIHSKDLAENYTTEFEQMFVDQHFGGSKKNETPHPTLTIADASVQNCFAPEGNCADLIVKTIDSAQTSIDFLAFSFTHEGIRDAMLDRAKAGVSVQGVFETTGSQTKYSAYGKLKDAGLAVYTDGNPWVMHHKVIVIDGHIVIFGSFNFSNSADESNDENLLIVDDANLASVFEHEFAQIFGIAQIATP